MCIYTSNFTHGFLAMILCTYALQTKLKCFGTPNNIKTAIFFLPLAQTSADTGGEGGSCDKWRLLMYLSRLRDALLWREIDAAME
mmetsp:Transcript_36955/g.75333  ORF Transcript_36955/g.75333 Transcript_36955/m.75333 type:complete len:85 (+) Transcript_36955:804-1058(+)